MSIDEVMATIPGYSLLPRAILRAAIEQHVAEAVARETERCADAARKWEDDYVMDDCAPEHVDVAIRARAKKETT
jgi:hypothetical protein